jgi:outer membrane autotransporter protein
MNHVFRIVFNRGLGLWQVVGEHTRKQGKRGSRSSPRKHLLAVRTPISAAVMAFASLGTLPTLAQAESITGSGDVAPALPAGPVTEWNVYDVLHIGQQGAGTLTVRDGAKLFSYTSRIGTESGSQGSVTIAGAGSTWTHAGHLMIGLAGHGTLNVEDGGQVSNDFASIGEQAGSFGLARITGGSTWKTSALWVGQRGQGELIVDGGSKVSSALPGFIGAEAGSEGIATVSGPGSSWSMTASGNDGRFEIAGSGTGTLNILNGGSVVSSKGLIGVSEGSKGAVKVSGEGSSWTNRDPQDASKLGSLFIGSSGTGTLLIEDGGQVSNDGGFVGYTRYGSGAVTVTGQGSLWNNASHLFVGGQGKARLDIRDGGSVTNLNGFLGSDVGNRGDASVSGLGSTWTNQGDLVVGSQGEGFLDIENGGKVTNVTGYVGRDTTGKGAVRVSGPGSAWENGLDFSVGTSGNGALTIENEGKVSAQKSAIIGHAKGGNGAVHVTTNASLETRGQLFVGLAGNGTLTVEQGGRVSSAGTDIGLLDGSSGTAIVAGAYSSLTTGDLTIGTVGKGTLNLLNGGVVSANTVSLGSSAGSGTLNIGSAAGEAATQAGILNTGKIQLGMGSATINFNHTDTNHTFGAELVSAGTGNHQLNQIAGVTRLTGDNAGFKGLTTVSSGTLIVADRISGAARVTGGTLQFGDGNSGRLSQLGGDLSVSGAGSTLAVKGPAALAVAGDLAMADQTVLSITAEAQEPAVQAQRMTLGQDVTFNLNGISEASQLDKVLIDTRTGINGDFDKITVGGFNGTVDYLTINTRKSDDQKQYLASYGLSWTAGNNLAHGTFTLASLTNAFDVGVALADQATNPSTGWNGKSLTKMGLGTLVLSADNTYSGGTTITDGTLQLGNGGNTGSIVGDVLNHGALAFNRNDSLTFAGAISGTGQVIQMGSGTTLLSGDNSYSGGTTLAGGTLQVTRDANMGDAAGGLTFTGGTLKTTDSFDTGRSMLLSRTGLFDVATASVLGLTGKVLGSGDLLKRGEGTLRLDNAANAYGDTLVQAGTLIGNAASISGNIGNAGTLVFDQATDADFAGNIAGLDGSKGQMVKQGGGNLTLSGNSLLDWSIRSGGLTSAAERFSGNADIASGAHLALNQKNDAAYAGTLSGAGLFIKDGSGALLLQEDSAGFTGLTRVEDGKLVVNGKLGGSMQVLAGSTLAGSGTIGSGAGSTVTIADSASLSPGNSIGTLKVDGDLVFQKGSRFVVEVDPDSKDSDLVKVSGNTVLNGGSVAHIGAAGNYKLRSTYTILASDKSLSGAFDEVTSDFAFLDPKLLYNYDLGTVDLSLTRNDRAFASVAMTRNQTATANAIDSIGIDAGHAVYDAIAQLPDDHNLIRGSFDQVSGEIHASMKSALIEESHVVRDAATDRLRAAFGDVGAASSPVIAYEDGQQQLVSSTTDRAAAWTQGFGAWGHTDSDGNAASLKRSTKGLLLGADAPFFDTWRLGLLAGYSHTSADIAGRSSSGNSDNYHLGAYAGTRWNLPQGTLGLRTGLSHTWHQIETSRSVAFPGFSDNLKDDYRAGTLQVFGDLGYRIDTPSVSLEPFINLAHTRQRNKGFSERGGAAALRGKAQSTDTTFTTLGLRASTKLDIAGVETTARGSLGWRHALGDTTPLSTHSFSAGNAFTVAGAPLAKNAALVEVGADMAITPSTSLGLSYDEQFTGSTRQHGLKASLNIRF